MMIEDVVIKTNLGDEILLELSKELQVQQVVGR